MPAIHLTITGKVQGVFYRATAKRKAEELGITGWVQNTPDDTVEIVANGTQDSLDTFIEWCWQGPSRAKVTGVNKEERKEEAFDEFTVKR